MQRTLSFALTLILVVVVVGGFVAFRQLKAADESVRMLEEGNSSLVLREQLRDNVLTMSRRFRELPRLGSTDMSALAVREAVATASGCNACHHDEEARHFIVSITRELEFFDGFEAPGGLGDDAMVHLERLRTLTESAARAGGDLVRSRGEAARDRLQKGRWIVGGVGISSMAFLLIVAWWVVWRVRNDVERLVWATRSLVTGGRDSVDWSVFRDEFRQVGEALQSMAEGLEEKERAERETLRKGLEADRVLSLARFASGLAHEVNNPLTGVVGFTDLLKKRAGKLDDEERGYLDRIKESGERAAEIISTLMTLSQAPLMQPSLIGLESLVAQVAEGVLGEPGSGRHGILSSNLTPVEVMADKDQLQQVVFCLLDNALRAVEGKGVEGGGVQVETRPDGNDALLRILDTGSGIPDEVIDRVFDPFFTTQEVGAGVGLGLAVSRQIVEAHGGSIALRSAPEKGTVVEVRIPAVGGPTSASP